MSRPLAALIAALLALPAAGLQDNPGGGQEDKKEEQQKKEDEAKAVLKAYREKRQKVKKEEDLIDAIGVLKEAKPHRLIRTELIALLEGTTLPRAVRIEAASALGDYKRDPVACDALVRRVRQERGDEATDLRRKCLGSFGVIAPFGKSVDVQFVFSDPDHAVAREAVDAVERIRSVRMLKPLCDLLGELERIRDDDGRDPGPDVPGGGAPPQQGDNNTKRKRKEVLLDPTLKAVNSLYAKIDSKKTFKNYTEAVRAVSDHRAKLKEVQEAEDKEDKKP